MPFLSVVVPTFNERSNVPALVEHVAAALAGTDWELIVVDDHSPDGTADAVRAIAQGNARVRCIERVGRRGLSSAVIEGIMSSSAPLVAVMDGDLQHDVRLLPRMLEALEDPGLDLVIGSRYVAGGGVDDWPAERRAMSDFATRLARLALKAEVTDPMSGFFMMRRDAFARVVQRLSGAGFKILLDVLASAAPPLRYRELPYRFHPRHQGESKIDARILVEYLTLLLDKTIGRVFPTRFILFCIVGGSGVVVHFIVLSLLFTGFGAPFVVAQTAAGGVAMTTNFLLNNVFTYRDQRLRGWRRLARGLLSFYAVCSVGFVANVGVAGVVFANQYAWWISGLAGIAVGTVWNYAASSRLTWRAT